jgi:tripartite-type tricarboxylate transporter receptor subunit TctC
LLGPAGTPKAVVDRINAEMKRAVANPEFIKQLMAIGLEPASSTPAEFHDMIVSELQRWTKVIREAGISAESAQ